MTDGNRPVRYRCVTLDTDDFTTCEACNGASDFIGEYVIVAAEAGHEKGRLVVCAMQDCITRGKRMLRRRLEAQGPRAGDAP